MLMGNVAALRSLHDCILANLPPCVVLYGRAIDWFDSAIDNPRQLDKTRAVLQLGLAKLYANRGQIDDAIASVRAAIKSDPDQIHYLFELASLYLTLGDLDAAEQTIEAADEKLDYSGFRHGILRDLKHNLEQARKRDNDATATSG
jgi:tetratricopeptide (TPR) repeat protein